jgi:aerobic-type carbon monoxide dehydrogenase small subunit (CoxS/CutS family)
VQLTLNGTEIVAAPREGLSDEERRLWAESFARAGASRSGVCSPGIVMNGETLLGRSRNRAKERA